MLYGWKSVSWTINAGKRGDIPVFFLRKCQFRHSFYCGCWHLPDILTATQDHNIGELEKENVHATW